jgi:hypothetical protein
MCEYHHQYTPKHHPRVAVSREFSQRNFPWGLTAANEASEYVRGMIQELAKVADTVITTHATSRLEGEREGGEQMEKRLFGRRSTRQFPLEVVSFF